MALLVGIFVEHAARAELMPRADRLCLLACCDTRYYNMLYKDCRTHGVNISHMYVNVQ